MRLIVIEFSSMRGMWVGREATEVGLGDVERVLGPCFDLSDWERSLLIRTEAYFGVQPLYWQVRE